MSEVSAAVDAVRGEAETGCGQRWLGRPVWQHLARQRHHTHEPSPNMSEDEDMGAEYPDFVQIKSSPSSSPKSLPSRENSVILVPRDLRDEQQTIGEISLHFILQFISSTVECKHRTFCETPQHMQGAMPHVLDQGSSGGIFIENTGMPAILQNKGNLIETI